MPCLSKGKNLSLAASAPCLEKGSERILENSEVTYSEALCHCIKTAAAHGVDLTEGNPDLAEWKRVHDEHDAAVEELRKSGMTDDEIIERQTVAA